MVDTKGWGKAINKTFLRGSPDFGLNKKPLKSAILNMFKELGKPFIKN